MVILFVTIIINISIIIRYKYLFSGRKSTSSKYLFYFYYYYYTQKQKQEFYIVQTAYTLEFGKVRNFNDIYGNFRKCGTRFYQVRSGAVQGFSNGLFNYICSCSNIQNSRS